MRVAITGAAGFIGSHMVDRLLAEGHEVVGIDNLDDYYSGKMRFLEGHMADPDFELHECSVLDLQGLQRLFSGVDTVLHLAAQAGVRISVRDPMRSHMANVTGTLNVLLAARDRGVRRVVSASSSSVYGNAESLPARESDRLVPVSPYAASKYSAELYARLFSELYGLETISMRYFTVYGPRQRPDMAIRIFVDRVMDGLPPQIFGDGEQSRDFTFISDVVEANCAAMTCPDPKGTGMNVCCGSTITVNRLVRRILEIMGREDLVPEHLPPQPGDVDHTWGDNSLARELMGWEPRVSIEEGLERFIRWYGENRSAHAGL